MRWLRAKPPLTLAQLAEEDLLAQLAELPVGDSVTLRQVNADGGLLVTRRSESTWVFERADPRTRKWEKN